MKVIFMDVDGELTYSDYENKTTANIDIEKVKLLKEICDKTGAKVVISSSWKGWGTYRPRIYSILLDILKKHGIEVIGETPHIPSDTEHEIPARVTLTELTRIKIKHGTGRAAEVARWLSENEVEGFVILDDEDFGWDEYGYANNWIQPTWFGDGGLKREHVKKAIGILNK